MNTLHTSKWLRPALIATSGSALVAGLFMLTPAITTQAATDTDTDTVSHCMHGDMRERRAERRLEHLTDAASILGMEISALEQAHKEGKTLAEIAEEKGITQEVFREKMQEKHIAHLAELVKNGTITQEQMDAKIAHMEEREAKEKVRPQGGRGMGQQYGAQKK